MTYQWIKEGSAVRRLADGACIPNDLRNADRQEFEAWRANGNEPLPVPAAHPNAAILEQLARIDRLAGGGRGLREFIIVQAQVTDALIAQGLLPGAAPISDNAGIVKLRELEQQAVLLRAQLVPQ